MVVKSPKVEQEQVQCKVTQKLNGDLNKQLTYIAEARLRPEDIKWLGFVVSFHLGLSR